MTGCEHEARVARAAREGRWTQALRDHRDRCSACAETALVTAALVADRSLDHDPLPDPHRVWLTARLRSRRLAAERATWPITLAYRVAGITAVAVVLALAPQLLEVLRGGLSAIVPPHASTALVEATTSPVAVLVATAVGLGGLFAVETAVRDGR